MNIGNLGKGTFVRWLAALAIACVGATAAAAAEVKEGYFITNDGYRLHYIEAGSGKPIVMIPGWSQSAAQWKHQMALADNYHVLAIDMRGHGESSKGDYGYRMHRLSKDVHDFIVAKDLQDVTLMGHSMGASVMWGYWDLYRDERLAKLIVVDQVPSCANNPEWTDEQKAQAGGMMGPDQWYGLGNKIAGSDEAFTAGLLSGMFTKAYSRDELAWVVKENLKFPREKAARLVLHHCFTDWRDLFKTIDVPTLIFGGKVSFFKVSALEWMQSQIPGSRLEVFTEAEGSAHFMFMENPVKFNAIVRDFMQ